MQDNLRFDPVTGRYVYVETVSNIQRLGRLKRRRIRKAKSRLQRHKT